MLSLCVTEPGMLQLENAGLRELLEDEVKIKVLYGGICGSDIAVFKGELPYAAYPVRPGHELVGTVIEKGESAAVEIGQRVVILPNTFCGSCQQCAKGSKNLCIEKKSLGVTTAGGFSEQFIISAKYVMPLPDCLTNERAVLTEPLAVIVHALKKASITKGTSMAVVGCGPEGVLAATLASYKGANVTAIDVNEKKLEKLKAFESVSVRKPEELTGNDQFDVVFEAAGTRSAVELAVNIVNPGGDMILVGFTKQALLPIVQIVRNEISLHGSIIYHYPDDFAESIQYLTDPAFKTEHIISKIIPFRDYSRAYEAALSKENLKIIIHFEEE